MLRGIYAPTDFESVDKDPRVSPEKKLSVIQASPTVVKHSEFGGFYVELPYGVGGFFWLGGRQDCRPDQKPYLLCDTISVGDKALYQNGLGSRLVRAAVRYGLEEEPGLHTFITGWARLGLLNTTVKVFGHENVAVVDGSESPRYGWQGDKPLEAIFDDSPPKENERYLVWSIEAQIDSAIAAGWEMPIISTTS